MSSATGYIRYHPHVQGNRRHSQYEVVLRICAKIGDVKPEAMQSAVRQLESFFTRKDKQKQQKTQGDEGEGEDAEDNQQQQQEAVEDEQEEQSQQEEEKEKRAATEVDDSS